MERMQGLIYKLQLLGYTILQHNSFAVVYIDSTKIKKLLKINGDGTIINQSNIDLYSICDNFALIGTHRWYRLTGLYCKDSKVNLLGNAQLVNLKYIDSNNYTVKSNNIANNKSEILMMETISGVYLINKQGKKKIMPQLKGYGRSKDNRGIVTDIGIKRTNHDTYIIGRGETISMSKPFIGIMLQSSQSSLYNSFEAIRDFDSILLEVDNEFNIINDYIE